MSNLEELTFFVDRALGKRHIPDMLRAAGCRVEVHDDHFENAALDVDWVPEVASRGWIILTKDEKIAYRTLERQAVSENYARVFVLASGNLSGTAMAIAFQKALRAMCSFIEENPAPFMAKVYKSGEVRSWKSRNELIFEE